MQDIKLVCTLDGTDYKEYEVLSNDQHLGVISWKGDNDPSLGSWYTTASDGNIRYFQDQEEVLVFLRDNPLKSAVELSATLKAEANRLTEIAEGIETESADVGTQHQ